ncbi:kinase/pyrophosphorylase [Pseudomonas putida]|uniref:kinase/pyrophosphorylase n=1 Tax=Pseudomonas putida TaxID=303 RepID=UPI0034D95B2E
MGPLMDLLSASVEEKPYNEPGIVHRLDDAYFKKIDAIEFAVKYDDGKDPKGLPKADIVLLGISRTSKTPLSQYLAHKSYKVMNVPIVPEVTPPDGLYDIDPKKCIALKISEEKLNRIRKERLKQLGLGDTCWAKPKPVVRLCGGNCSVMNAGSGAMTMAVSTASTEMSAETVTHEDDPTAVRIPAKAG